MQEKIQKFSPIKQRILTFVETIKVTKRNFYKETGISRGTLENPSGITEDTLAKFIAIYKQVNVIWLILGEGDMLDSYNYEQDQNIISDIQGTYEKISEADTDKMKEMDLIILDQTKEIYKLKAIINKLQNQLRKNGITDFTIN